MFKTVKEQPMPVEGTVKGNADNIIHDHVSSPMHLGSRLRHICGFIYHLVCHFSFAIGSIPLWVSGRLLRNGPGMFEIGDTRFKHWFDGLALLHSFTIANG